jgi:hypothetical protein
MQWLKTTSSSGKFWVQFSKKKKTPSSSLDGYFECSSLDDHLGKPFSEEGGSWNAFNVQLGPFP